MRRWLRHALLRHSCIVLPIVGYLLGLVLIWLVLDGRALGLPAHVSLKLLAFDILVGTMIDRLYLIDLFEELINVGAVHVI